MSITTVTPMARRTLLATLWAFSALPMGEVMAGASDCYAIKDADKRTYCLATVKRDYGYCHRIKDSDLRNQCLAEIKGNRDWCYAIKEQDTRKACLMKTHLLPWQ